MSQATTTTALVVPCYQEESALDAFAPVLAGIPVDEVVFVDDGSTDGTAGRLRELARGDPRVRVRTHERNRGVGAAMRTGLAGATSDVVVVYDADCTYPPGDVRRLVETLERVGADVVTASPLAAGGGVERVPPFRLLLTRGAAACWRLAIGPRARGLSTFTCAFRAYRRSALEDLDFASDGFPAAAEILARLLLGGARVVEMPSRLGRRVHGTSKMRVLAALCGHLRAIVRVLALRLRP